MTGLLVSTKQCPVCGNPTTLNQRVTGIFNDTDGRQYLDSMYRDEKSELDDLLNQLTSVQCGKCGAYYLDPWLSVTQRNRIFITGHGIHNVGWRNFQERIERNSNPSLVLHPQEILEFIGKHITRFETYAEFGCPFQGLLLHFADDDSIDLYAQHQSDFASMQQRHYQRFLLPIRLFMTLAKRVKNFALLLSRIRRARNRLRKRWERTQVMAHLKPQRKFFVPLHSSGFWGQNCAVYGDSCIATSSRALGAEVLSLAQLTSLGSETKIDVIGLFNVLDHQDNPLDLIKLCLANARVLVCMGHSQPFGKQHQIGLGEDFFEKLESTVGNCQVHRLHNIANRDLLYIITSNDSGPRSE